MPRLEAPLFSIGDDVAIESAIRDPHGTTIGFLSSGIDITTADDLNDAATKAVASIA